MSADTHELAPESTGPLNILAVAQAPDKEGDARQEALLLSALARAPGDGVLHSNLGRFYLNRRRDYASAEAAFRRSLAILPAFQEAQKGLFAAIRHRDPIYRVLSAPRSLLRQARTLGSGAKIWPVRVIYLGAVGVLAATSKLAAAILLLACMVWWPLSVMYERLTIVDIKRKAGVVGATRGGLFGHRRWPLKTRLAVCGLGLVGVWACVAFLMLVALHNDALAPLLAVIPLGGLLLVRFWPVLRPTVLPCWLYVVSLVRRPTSAHE